MKKRRPPNLDTPYLRHRPLSEGETALWQETMGDKPPARSAAKKPASSQQAARTGAVPDTKDIKLPRSKPKQELLSPQAVDARTRAKIRKGRLAIEATLDLHGHNRMTAHAVLVRFIESAQTRGAGLVLIITGKGRAGKDGVLRDELPRWLNESPLRKMVIAYDSAELQHGGGGAWYVRIRKKKTETQ